MNEDEVTSISYVEGGVELHIRLNAKGKTALECYHNLILELEKRKFDYMLKDAMLPSDDAMLPSDLAQLNIKIPSITQKSIFTSNILKCVGSREGGVIGGYFWRGNVVRGCERTPEDPRVPRAIIKTSSFELNT